MIAQVFILALAMSQAFGSSNSDLPTIDLSQISLLPGTISGSRPTIQTLPAELPSTQAGEPTCVSYAKELLEAIIFKLEISQGGVARPVSQSVGAGISRPVPASVAGGSHISATTLPGNVAVVPSTLPGNVAAVPSTLPGNLPVSGTFLPGTISGSGNLVSNPCMACFEYIQTLIATANSRVIF